MHKIDIYWTNQFRKDEKEQFRHGTLRFAAKNKPEHYRKYFLLYSHGNTKELAYKDQRYIQWVDRHDFVTSGYRNPLKGLKKKYGYHYEEYPKGFDHTKVFRTKGVRYPELILTEPYHINDETLQEWDCVAHKRQLKYKVYDPSPKSLWYPDSTYMVFWWNPELYSFDGDFLMGHDDMKYEC